ncbi:MAG: hypothetical protein ACLQPV_02740 [Vulcanimicrobiaceae bacterium]
MRQLALVLAIAVLSACGGGSRESVPGGGTLLPDGAAPAVSNTAGSGVPTIGGCQIFPADNPWNTNISNYPLDPNSNNYINTILTFSSNTHLHPDFGQDPTYGIPFIVVGKYQPRVPMSFQYASESDPGPYPFPANAPIEGGSASTGDRHVLVLEQGICQLFETWSSYPQRNGASWKAGSGARFFLTSDALRPHGWTSADAAGLPILPALVKCAEVKAGVINHALRVTFNRTQDGYISPARHYASSYTNANYPPMGLRLRLKASYDISGFNTVSKIILTAMKQYGMFVADNGSDWYFQGEGTGNNPSSCWNDNELDQLKSVPGSAFEVVETGKIVH